MQKLHHKLAAYVLGSLVLVSVLTMLLVLRNQRNLFEEDLEYSGKMLADTVAAFCVETILEADYPYLETYIRKAARNSPQIVFIRVWSEFEEEGDIQSRNLVAQYPPASELPEEIENQLIFQSPIVMEVKGFTPEVIGQVVVALSTKRHAELLTTNTWHLVAGATFAFLLLAWILSLTLKRNVLKPLGELDLHANRIGRGDLGDPIDLARRDELGRLARTMESMRLGLKRSYARIEKQVEELKELDRMKDEFLASVSHELKTPLNGILGLTESLLLGDYGDTPESCRNPLETISSCGERLLHMTDSILQYSQLMNRKGGSDVTYKVHVLEEHLSECLLDILTAADRKGIRLMITVPPGMEVKYARSELEQIIRILADNAVKFTDSGVVQVIARRWTRCKVPGFQIAVRDTGRGVPEKLRKAVFDPFVQGFGHETRKHSGVGLGLAIARKLTQDLGWHLILESEEGRGSSFTVLVPEVVLDNPENCFVPWPPLERPAALEEPGAVEPDSTPGPQRLRPANDPSPGQEAGPKPHILVTDDDEVNREVLLLALKGKYRVSQATNGESCLAILEKEPVDLLVLDIMMPKVSGYDVLKRMRARGLLEKVPVIVLSAKASPKNIVQGLRLGASDYLGKPFHRDELLCRIQTQLKLKAHKEKLAEEVAVKTEALNVAAEASKVKSQFLANMSHEILTPLNGINGFLDLAGSEDALGEPDQLKDYLAKAQECTQSLLELANDILDVAKIESHAKDVTRQQCRPRAVIEDVVGEFSEHARKKRIRLDFHVAEEAESPFTTDVDRFRKIIASLVGNAVKFTEKGGVRVVARHVGEPGSEGHKLLIEVIDTGIGLKPTEYESIFEAFHQVDRSSTRAYGGAGLGLCLCRSYAHILGGEVTVRSTPGEGSTFTVSLPLAGKPPCPSGPTDLPHQREERVESPA